MYLGTPVNHPIGSHFDANLLFARMYVIEDRFKTRLPEDLAHIEGENADNKGIESAHNQHTQRSVNADWHGEEGVKELYRWT